MYQRCRIGNADEQRARQGNRPQDCGRREGPHAARNYPMRHVLLTATLLAGSVGCQSGVGLRCDPCGQAASCPAPCAGGHPPEEVEVRVPRQKVVVEVPPPAASCQPAAPCQAPAQPAPAPAMPTMGYPQQMMAPATAQVQERTRLGFMFDTIRLPIPIIRPIAVPRPPEMTMTVPLAPAAPAMMPMAPAMTMAAPMVPMAAAAPAMMPMAAPAMTMAAPAMTMAAPAMAMVPQPQMGFGSMSIQGTMSVQQLLMMLAAQGGVNPAQLNMLLQLAASGQLPPQLNSFLMQLGAQTSMSPAQIAAAIQAYLNTTSGGGTTPPGGGTGGTPPAGRPSGGGTTTPSSGGGTAAPPSGTSAASPPAPSSESIHEQVQFAERAFKNL